MKLKAEIVAHLDMGRNKLAVCSHDPFNAGICEELLSKEWDFDANKDVFLSDAENCPVLFPRPNIGETITVDVSEDGVLLSVCGTDRDYGLDRWRHPDYYRLMQS